MDTTVKFQVKYGMVFFCKPNPEKPGRETWIERCGEYPQEFAAWLRANPEVKIAEAQ